MNGNKCTGRESNSLEFLRLSREWCEAEWEDEPERNPTGDGHRYGRATENEIERDRHMDADDASTVNEDQERGQGQV